ncbi:MAG TPA: hypothetical protein VKB83_01035 [Nitrosopumilaceae archaeon]|nr:hypothetical protein [Nitrosopumilaceae archaeon]
MAICLICGKYDEVDLKKAMSNGWVFTRCPECQRGNQFDIIVTYLTKTVGEKYLEGFCHNHWFKDSGICGYCKMKREGYNENVA